MLAKVLRKRKDSKSNFAALVKYVIDRDDNDSDNNKEEQNDALDPGDRKPQDS